MRDKTVLKRGTLQMNLDDFLKLANSIKKMETEQEQETEAETGKDNKEIKKGERYEMNDNNLGLEEIVNVVVETLKTADDVIKLHEQFKRLTEDARYAFICSEIEYMSEESGVCVQDVLSNIIDVMTD